MAHPHRQARCKPKFVTHEQLDQQRSSIRHDGAAGVAPSPAHVNQAAYRAAVQRALTRLQQDDSDS